MANKSYLDLDYAKYDFKDTEKPIFKSEKGLSRQTVEQISDMKKEPEWMKKFRLRAYEHFIQRPMPTWGGNLSHIDFNDIYYYLKPTDKVEKSWDDVPEKIKKTFDRLGIPEAEKKFLAGVGAQYECLSGDSRVYTSRGPVPIRDVNPGDTVFSFDEETGSVLPSKVRAKAFKGQREVFAVQIGSRVIEATINHPFLVLAYRRLPGKKRGRYHREWRYLHELRRGDLVGIPKLLPDIGQPHSLRQPLIQTIVAGRNQYVQYDLDVSHSYNEVRLPTETTPDLMWFLGLYLGDGFIHHHNGSDKARVEVAIPASDRPLRKELSKVSQGLFGLDAHDKDSTRVTLYSTVLARFIEDNEFGGTAHTKLIPQWVFTLPRDQKLAFIGGYVDSDGYVRDSAKNHDICITSANKSLLEGIKALCVTVGLPTSNIHRFESKHPFDTNRKIIGYRIQIYGDFERITSRSPERTKRFGRRKYYHNYTSTKGTKFAKHTNEFLGFAKIGSILPRGVKPVYDIEVDGPHNFVAEGIIVHNSEVVYHSLLKHLEDKGVIFCDTDTALKLHPEIVKKHFGTVIPPEDNKMAALNSAVWSGGSFIYVPPGVKVDLPLQAYFRINAANMGQFERTLIIADEYADVQYIEGCLPYEEKISTGESMVQIGQVMPDDVVVNGEGEETLVRSARARDYEGDLVEITPLSSQNAFRLTPEHPVLTVQREHVYTTRGQRSDWLREVDSQKLVETEPYYLPAGELVKGDFLVFPINRESEDNPAYDMELLRLLGYYLAEGSAFIHKTLGVAVTELAFGAHEKAMVDEVSGLITRLTGKSPNLIKYKSGLTLVSYSRKLMETCLRECGKGAYSKKLSRNIMRLPPEKQRHLLETYLKGDGNVYTRNRTLVRASTASEQLAFQIQELFSRQGIYASINLRKGGEDTIAGRKINRRDQYVISYSLDKKWSAVRKTANHFLVPIKRIRTFPHIGKVYNIEVADSSQSYLARGFVVHNCTAPVYSTDSLHSAVVEIIAKKGARVRYTTLQNWSSDVYNLVTKRAYAYEDASVEWIDANVGSKLTMKYPSVYLVGPRARAEIVSVAFAGKDRHQDTGAKAVHLAPYTSSRITAKSVSKDGGLTTYRGLVHVAKGAVGVKSSVRCDALLMDAQSKTSTYPYMEVNEDDATITHEATVGRINEDQLFYLMSRGLTETQALSMIVTGFMEPFTRVLPMEYAVEFNRLIEMEMEGAVG